MALGRRQTFLFGDVFGGAKMTKVQKIQGRAVQDAAPSDGQALKWNTTNSQYEPGDIGYLNIPQNSQSANYTAVLGDSGKHLFHPASDNNPRTFTIPANASVAYPIGTAITFVNKINTLTIAINSDTLTLAEDGTTGSRTLATNGIATALKISSTEWLISGKGLS